jgi:plastocyanin
MHHAMSPERARAARLVAAGLVLVAVASCGGDDGARRDVEPTPLDLSTVGRVDVTVTFAGTPPPPRPINMRSSPACAAAHSGPVYDTSLVVTDGRLANAVVWLATGLEDRVFAIPEEPVTMDQKGCTYTPRVVGVMVGQPVNFVNSDPEAHNVHGKPTVAKGWNFMMSRQGLTRTVTMSEAEVGISVACDVHPWMQGYISAFEHPYFAITPADGAVSLPRVPPGTYTVAVWHETLGTKEQTITLEPRGTAAVRFAFE